MKGITLITTAAITVAALAFVPSAIAQDVVDDQAQGRKAQREQRREQHQQYQERFEQRKQMDSAFYQARIDILQKANTCIRAANDPAAYRECKIQEHQAQRQLRKQRREQFRQMQPAAPNLQ